MKREIGIKLSRIQVELTPVGKTVNLSVAGGHLAESAFL